MTNAVDNYLEVVVKGGDDVSARLEKKFAPTLKNSSYVDIISEGMNSVKVIRPPAGYYIAVHSLGGNADIADSREYGRSVVDRLTKAAERIGAIPIAFTNVIDASTTDWNLIEPFADGMVDRANHFKYAMPNGEFAMLGNRVAVDANVSATMISLVSANNSLPLSEVPGFFNRDGVMYAVFDPKGKAVYMNSDGVGTKMEFYERSGNISYARRDSDAMKRDDLVKIGAEAQVVSDVIEMNEDAYLSRNVFREADGFKFEEGLGGGLYIYQPEKMKDRIRSCMNRAFNMSGSAVSTIDEERLRNPLKPSAGEYLVAIRGKPNPRSNGITDKREIMIKLFGDTWHKTDIGKIFMEYLGQPSTVFYGVFKELIDAGLATSVYHMSGGAFKGKLAKPLAKHNLFAKLENLFEPDWRELTLAGAKFTSAETAYSKWPMGNEGFVTTRHPEEVMDTLIARGLEGRVVSQLQIASAGYTGVELAGIKASNGQHVYFSGRD